MKVTAYRRSDFKLLVEFYCYSICYRITSLIVKIYFIKELNRVKNTYVNCCLNLPLNVMNKGASLMLYR